MKILIVQLNIGGSGSDPDVKPTNISQTLTLNPRLHLWE